MTNSLCGETAEVGFNNFKEQEFVCKNAHIRELIAESEIKIKWSLGWRDINIKKWSQ